MAPMGAPPSLTWPTLPVDTVPQLPFTQGCANSRLIRVKSLSPFQLTYPNLGRCEGVNFYRHNLNAVSGRNSIFCITTSIWRGMNRAKLSRRNCDGMSSELELLGYLPPAQKASVKARKSDWQGLESTSFRVNDFSDLPSHKAWRRWQGKETTSLFPFMKTGILDCKDSLRGVLCWLTPWRKKTFSEGCHSPTCMFNNTHVCRNIR